MLIVTSLEKGPITSNNQNKFDDAIRRIRQNGAFNNGRVGWFSNSRRCTMSETVTNRT